MDSLYESNNRIERLKKRASRCVCRFCGGKLRLRQIVFSDIDEVRVEIFCGKCESIEFGVEPEIYACAHGFVENLEFNYYEGLDQNAKTKKMNIAKVCDILSWSCKNMGLINQDGFTVPIKLPVEFGAECLSFTSDEIDSDKSFEDYVEELSCQ